MARVRRGLWLKISLEALCCRKASNAARTSRSPVLGSSRDLRTAIRRFTAGQWFSRLLRDHRVQTQNGLLFEDRSNSQCPPMMLGSFGAKILTKLSNRLMLGPWCWYCCRSHGSHPRCCIPEPAVRAFKSTNLTCGVRLCICLPELLVKRAGGKRS
jgi:hypothetical protein